MTGMRTTLGKVRHLGSAHSGTGHFWTQRLTAVLNLILVTATFAVLVSLSGAGYEETVATLTNPFVAILLLLTIINVSTHMRLGMQVFIEDYVHGESLRLLALIANTAFSAAVALAALYAVLKLNFGS